MCLILSYRVTLTIVSWISTETQGKIQKLVQYHVLIQKCSDRMRHVNKCDLSTIYDDALKEWNANPSNPLIEPDRGKASFLYKSGRNMWITASNYQRVSSQWFIAAQIKQCRNESYFKVSFACWAGIDLLRHRELSQLPNYAELMGELHNLV
jgi:hypothetical protein